jgi:long-chain acyl-CoA synthetase
MNVPKLLDRMREFKSETALIANDTEINYNQFVLGVEDWVNKLAKAGINSGQIVSIEGDYSLPAISALLALWDLGCVAVPLAPDSKSNHELFCEVASVEYRISIQKNDGDIHATGIKANHELYKKLKDRSHPGLVLFTSGSTGPNKAAVHDAAFLLKKFEARKRKFRTLVFLQMDHIGGVNTLLYTFSNGGAVIVAPERTPEAVCTIIERHKVELLPTSPTFLNLMLLFGGISRYDLSSLKVITYGTEPMPEITLSRIAEELPEVKLQQTYGMTELGILRSKSRDSQSLWVRVGGEGFETKVVDDRLWVRAESAMLGYLNAPSPFDEEGFLDTGDRVEVDGEWIRILGRVGETINIGGSKVNPAEVENVLLQIEGVSDAVVSGESHPITGQIVVATIELSTDESIGEFKVRARTFCRSRLPTYAIPSRFKLSQQKLYSDRFKRIR